MMGAPTDEVKPSAATCSFSRRLVVIQNRMGEQGGRFESTV